MKRRMLAPSVIEAALAAGQDLKPDTTFTAPDGRVVSYRGNQPWPYGGQLSVSGGAFVGELREQVFTEEDAPRLRFAWGPDGSVLLAIDYPASHFAKDAANVQIDPACGCMLQVIDAKPWGGPRVPRVDVPAGTVRLHDPVFTGVDDVEVAKGDLTDLEEILTRCLKLDQRADAGPSRYDADVRMSLAIAAGGKVTSVSLGPSKVPESTQACFRRLGAARLFPLQKSHEATIAFDLNVHRE
jgi:hypothetical protein